MPTPISKVLPTSIFKSEIQQEIVGLNPLICSKIKEWDYHKLCFYDTSYFGVSSLNGHIWLMYLSLAKFNFTNKNIKS